jgi:3-isopropylmalate/(R)-2-methylmalate dehydratase large subunit
MTLANMSAELGGQAGLIAPDDTTMQWLAATGAPAVDITGLNTDAAAVGSADCETHRFDAAALEPFVAAPHSPANAQGVGRYAGTPVNVAYIGACTGAKIDDLRAAAEVLRGHRAAANVRLMVAPASLQDQEAARREGVLQVLLDAGAQLLATACGACAGYGDAMPDDAVVISSTARNFRGRMGSPLAQVYLGSPYTVAASALRGVITDPREVMRETRS